jgi:predicted O-methyltransferase YrrM
MQQQIKNAARHLVRQFPPLRRLLDERDFLFHKLKRFGNQTPFVPNGHFYSPIPALEEVRHDESRIFRRVESTVAGVDLAEESQLTLLREFAHYYNDLPFPEQRKAGFRYFFENSAYSYSDAIFLHCMIRHAKPRRIIEVGSGYSSCMTLDTNERFFDGTISCTFIEPYPELLRSLLREGDFDCIRILPHRLQEVDLSVFRELAANDILFIDSTHVSKTGSDVNRAFFDVLPILARGVYIHFHDVFYPFEYPKEWVYEGRAWNELYMLRSFLQYNSEFRVVCFNTFLEQFHEKFFVEHMPLCLKNRGGSIWLQKC